MACEYFLSNCTEWVIIFKLLFLSYILILGFGFWDRTSHRFSILLTIEVVPNIFSNLNVVTHLVVPAGWGSCLLRRAIFSSLNCSSTWCYDQN